MPDGGILSGIGAAAGAGASMTDTALTNATNVAMQQQAEQYNSQQVLQQEAYQTQMSNSAYQRGTADMKAAGINPMAAYQQGGASTPSGSSASIQPLRVSSSTGLAQSVNSALDGAKLGSQLKTASAQGEIADSQAEAAANKADQSESDARSAAARMKVLESNVPAQTTQAGADLVHAKQNKDNALIDSIGDRGRAQGGWVNSAIGALSSIFGYGSGLTEGSGQIIKDGPAVQKFREDTNKAVEDAGPNGIDWNSAWDANMGKYGTW